MLFLLNDSKGNFWRVMPLLHLFANSWLESILVTICMYKRKIGIEFETTISNIFSDDWFNFWFRRNCGFKMTWFFNMCVWGLPHSHGRVQGFFMEIKTFWSLNCPECKIVHKITIEMLFFGKCVSLLFYLGKALNRVQVILGVIHGDLDFFDLH